MRTDLGIENRYQSLCFKTLNLEA